MKAMIDDIDIHCDDDIEQCTCEDADCDMLKQCDCMSNPSDSLDYYTDEIAIGLTNIIGLIGM